ncbi:MAG: hypothetical protein HON53_11925 [Planctomycetaceae bacterium]|jgi:hypothetical protein|nr:hypothetical protein [Planctomycetaceae bacterium]MBT6157483.1 hypothetical protein [Planctomycetaceae bacterium]MBT6488080.1 hypothetical protein [Planctomycetaceae bacterium]MBT6495291.1 hypothetical protein [Planctomycetaceae bacterium]
MLQTAKPNRNLIGALGATGILCCVFVLTGLASANGQEPANKAKGETSESQTQDKNKTGSATDEELFKKLTGGGTTKDRPQENPLEQAIRAMREAQKRIDGKDAGLKTRELQQDVVKNLEQLIEAVKQQAQSSPSGGKSPKPQDGDPKQKGSKPPEPAETQPGDNGKTRKDKSPESTDKARDAENRQLAPLSSGRMVRDVWGHLPPTLRQKLLNVYEDKYLPKYDDLVRRYFESLAEEGRTAPRKK